MIQEIEMIPVIENFFHQQGYYTYTEVSVGGAGNGIADVVAIKFNQKNVKKRIDNNQLKPVKKEILLDIWGYISEQESGTKINEIQHSFSYSKPHINNLLNELISSRFIVEEECGVYRKINNIVPLVSEVVAIEAKKEAWIAATQQARRYQNYANKVYVALLSEFSHRVDKERLKKNNIGLISIDVEKERANYLWKSRARKPLNSNINFLAHEAVWERFVDSGTLLNYKGENETCYVGDTIDRYLFQEY